MALEELIKEVIELVIELVLEKNKIKFLASVLL